MTNELETAIVAINPDLEGRLAKDLAEKLSEQGWVQATANERPPSLYDFATLEARVEVFHPLTGDWLPGFVSALEHGFLHVETERGPISVASVHRIRWPQAEV